MHSLSPPLDQRNNQQNRRAASHRGYVTPPLTGSTYGSVCLVKAMSFSARSHAFRALAPLNRRAMMSALSARRGPTAPVEGTVPSLSDPPTPPTTLSPDAASPQVAARPPQVPKVEKPRPKLT